MTPLVRAQLHREDISSVAVLPMPTSQQMLLVTAAYDGEVIVWELDAFADNDGKPSLRALRSIRPQPNSKRAGGLGAAGMQHGKTPSSERMRRYGSRRHSSACAVGSVASVSFRDHIAGARAGAADGFAAASAAARGTPSLSRSSSGTRVGQQPPAGGEGAPPRGTLDALLEERAEPPSAASATNALHTPRTAAHGSSAEGDAAAAHTPAATATPMTTRRRSFAGITRSGSLRPLPRQTEGSGGDGAHAADEEEEETPCVEHMAFLAGKPRLPLLSVGTDGCISVWDVFAGCCAMRFPSGHEEHEPLIGLKAADGIAAADGEDAAAERERAENGAGAGSSIVVTADAAGWVKVWEVRPDAWTKFDDGHGGTAKSGRTPGAAARLGGAGGGGATPNGVLRRALSSEKVQQPTGGVEAPPFVNVAPLPPVSTEAERDTYMHTAFWWRAHGGPLVSLELLGAKSLVRAPEVLPASARAVCASACVCACLTLDCLAAGRSPDCCAPDQAPFMRAPGLAPFACLLCRAPRPPLRRRSPACLLPARPSLRRALSSRLPPAPPAACAGRHGELQRLCLALVVARRARRHLRATVDVAPLGQGHMALARAERGGRLLVEDGAGHENCAREPRRRRDVARGSRGARESARAADCGDGGGGEGGGARCEQGRAALHLPSCSAGVGSHCRAGEAARRHARPSRSAHGRARGASGHPRVGRCIGRRH